LHRKIALSLLLTTMMLASMFLFVVPVVGLDFTSPTGERQLAVMGNLHNETFPEWNFTYWEKQGIELGFTGYGETVTDVDPFDTGSKYGVGLSYPAGDELVAEHLATPAGIEGEDYYPIEGWQLLWRWNEESAPVLWARDGGDNYTHIHMAIYGNETAPHNVRARVGVTDPETEIITNTSRLFAARTTFFCENQTLTEIGVGPTVFKVVCTYVFFKNTKKIVQFWSIEYLRTEAPAVDVIFRRLTDFDIDNKYQDFENEGYAVFFPHSGRAYAEGEENAEDHPRWAIPDPDLPGKHKFWTGCDYWPQNYSLAVVWTNETVEHWTEPDASHHVGFVAYFPNCSNWNTDDWNFYLYNLWAQWYPSVAREAWLELNPLAKRYQGQPWSREFRETDTGWVGANLLMGQWNFTLTSATTKRKALFVNVLGITNCSDTFGYEVNKYLYDWDSEPDLDGSRTVGEIKYLLSEVFNATYKLSSEWHDLDNDPQDLSQWYPFAGTWGTEIELAWGNSWLKRHAGNEMADGAIMFANPRNTTFIYGESAPHNGMVFTSEAASVVDVVGGTEVGEAFGAYVGPPWGFPDPWFEAMWDTTDFMGGVPGPFYGTAPDFFKTVDGKDFIDSPGIVPMSWDFSGWRRRQNRTVGDIYDASGVDFNLFTTPTGFSWDVNHTIVVGGPKVNLAAEYFNDHTWAIWTSEDSGCEIEELLDGGIYVFPSGNIYTEDFSVITICDDLNLTSWTAIYDEEPPWRVVTNGWAEFQTDLDPLNLDGPTLVDPYAGLLIWGISGWDTRAACNWLAHYWWEFDDLGTSIRAPWKRGVTTLILYTPEIAEVVDEGWDNGIKEVLGPCAGVWRHSIAAWDVLIEVPCQVEW